MILASLFVLASPCLLLIAQKAIDNGLPSWLTVEDAVMLSGGGEESSLREQLTLHGFKEKRLQKAVETEIGNHIPMKAFALLGNASIQRYAIEQSNLLFSWDAYPAFFGSSRLCDPEADAIVRMPVNEDDILLADASDFAAQLSAFAERHSELDFCVIIADQSDFSATNPAMDLMSSAVTTDQVAAEMAKGAWGGRGHRSDL